MTMVIHYKSAVCFRNGCACLGGIRHPPERGIFMNRVFGKSHKAKCIILFALTAIGLAVPGGIAFAQDHYYVPLQLSLVPGLALPFGTGDVGISLGSVGNISGDVGILQASGVFNIAENVQGIQAAGVFNIAEDVYGIQVAGVFNIADHVRSPLQMAGVFNITGDVDGIQTAGTFNIADDIRGIQVAPLFNVADTMEGVQIGLVNVAGHVSGFQIGLVNISDNGVFDAEAAYQTQTGFYSGTLKTGNTGMFAFYSAAAPAEDWFIRPDNFVLSAGLGTRFGDSRTMWLDLEAGAANALGPNPERLFDGLRCSDGLQPADVLSPWPVINAGLGVSFGPLNLNAGGNIDVDLADAPNVPAGLKKGWVYSDTWFGTEFSAWTKWYLGVSI